VWRSCSQDEELGFELSLLHDYRWQQGNGFKLFITEGNKYWSFKFSSRGAILLVFQFDAMLVRFHITKGYILKID